MKREKLLEKINEIGAVFVRHGKKHDIYENPRTHEFTSIAYFGHKKTSII